MFDENSLNDRKYSRYRKLVAKCAASRCFSILMGVITIIYAVELLLYLSAEDFLREELTAIRVILGFEGLILFFFTFDFIINICAFRRHYFHDKLVAIEIIGITLTLCFLVAESITGETTGLFSIRGVFRIFRLFILFRKVSFAIHTIDFRTKN